ncbi:hypothetical protein H9L17_06605 [Thermomonas brevis]|uniref:Uncharacterized protein n=1 Tax=Thermomonas brevis TaxID=215691 RepID=A0A7G9QWR9_9GAMM|nr:hypothetical protein [Thermomonas brevis]QNN47794.1 hypothetical protein H9L17_06605 [Thermomonas brevis]
MQRRHALYAALAATLAALPAASQQGKAPPTNLYIDVATHSMAGMPDMGGMMGGLGGFMARRMGGGNAGKPTYPTARHAGTTGQFLDIALHNALKPGAEAQDLIPGGLQLGKSLTLIPVEPTTPAKGDSPPGKVPDVEVKISEYWGCGESVRPGQPKVATFKIKGGDRAIDPKNPMAGMQGVGIESTGSLSKGLYAPDRDIDLKPGYVYWPNRDYGKQVPTGARLAGEHRITGDGIPASMRFAVEDDADFMPKLALRTQGGLDDAIGLDWPAVERARAYFITGVHMQMLGEHSFAMTVWSSAEAPGAGSELHAYLGGGQIDKWLKQKILLPATATGCTIPKGIFAGASTVQGQQQAMPGMLAMTAYGPERWITWPPKPADPKQPWNPEWSVRLRAKSSATAMLGVDLGGVQRMDGGNGQQPRQQQTKPTMKGLLKGLLGH